VLEPWYAQPDLDPDMLAKERSDFGEMFLTPGAPSATLALE
jgi:hypothetical protein